mgnify:CR=1 FL=1
MLTEPFGHAIGRDALAVVWWIAPPLLIAAALTLRRAAEPMEIAKEIERAGEELTEALRLAEPTDFLNMRAQAHIERVCYRREIVEDATRLHGDVALHQHAVRIALDDLDERRPHVPQAGNAQPQRPEVGLSVMLLHRLEDARARFGSRLASFTQVEDKQRIAGDRPAEARGRPAPGGDKGLDGLAKGLDIGHVSPRRRAIYRNLPIRQ